MGGLLETLPRPIGMIIDAADGGMYKLTPGQIIATLGKDVASVSKDGDNIYIGVVLKADSSWERVGTLEKAK